MLERWKTAALGGLIGAVISSAIFAAAVALNIVPVASDARLHDYLYNHPKIALEMQAIAEAQEAEDSHKQQQAAIDKIGLKRLLDPTVAFVTGPAGAKNTFVEFYDYNCGHCRNTSATVRKFYDKHKNDTRFAFVEFPIFGEASNHAARTSVAAHKQADKFLDFHFALMSEGRSAIDRDILLANAQKVGLDVVKLSADLNTPETDKALLGGYRLAREAKFNGTPVFIINGKVHEGEITEAELKQLIH